MASSLSGALLYGASSTTQAASVLNQVEFIPRVIEKLKATPDEVVADMLTLRQHRECGRICIGGDSHLCLTQLLIHLVCDLELLVTFLHSLNPKPHGPKPLNL